MRRALGPTLSFSIRRNHCSLESFGRKVFADLGQLVVDEEPNRNVAILGSECQRIDPRGCLVDFADCCKRWDVQEGGIKGAVAPRSRGPGQRNHSKDLDSLGSL